MPPPVRVALDVQRSNAPESNAANEHRKTDGKDGQGNPAPASIPRNARADDLRRIRERRNQITPLNRPRRSIAPPKNTSQRTAGSMLFKSNDQQGGWLDK